MSIEISLENKVTQEDLAQKLIYNSEALQDQARVVELISQIKVSDERKSLTKKLNEQLSQVKNNRPIGILVVKPAEFAKTDPVESKLARSGIEKAKQGEHLSAIETVVDLKNELLRSQTLTDIGIIIDQHGLDATPVFYLALDAVRDYMNDPKRDSLDMLEGVDVTEEVLSKAIHIGYFHIVREVVERTSNRKDVNPFLLTTVIEAMIDSLTVEKSKGQLG